MENRVRDAIFLDIHNRFGVDTPVETAVKFAHEAILQQSSLRPRAALLAIHYHLCDLEAKGLEIPQCGEILLSQIVSAGILAEGNIVEFDESMSEDAIFLDIHNRFGVDTPVQIAVKFALKAILQPRGAGRALRSRAGKAAQYLHRLFEGKTDGLHAIHYHLFDLEAKGLEIPRCGETLLSQMSPDYVLAEGNIVDFNVADDQVLDAAGAHESACAREIAVAFDDSTHISELLSVSTNCLREASERAAKILGIKDLKEFRRSLKSIPQAALRVASINAKIDIIKYYSSPRVSIIRDARLRPIYAAAERGDYEAVRAVGALKGRTDDIDRSLIALVLPVVYCVGTFARLVRLDTLKLACVLRYVRLSAQHALDAAALDAAALDACVALAIEHAAKGEEPPRCSPRKRKS